MAGVRGSQRRAAVLALAALVVVALGGTALAAFPTSDVKSYAGCLVSNDGVIVKVKEGDSPKSACTGGQTLVHLSGGDITKISVTGALTGGGDNGEVTIGLKPEATLPSGCANGQVAEWNGSAWVCAVDNDTTYTAGTGLDLSAGPTNAFSIEPGYRLPGKSCSTSGEFARGFESDGDIQCAAPSAGAQVFANLMSPESGIGIPDDGLSHQVVSLTVPPGAYSITTVGNGTQAEDREWQLLCRLSTGSEVLSNASVTDDEDTYFGVPKFGRSLAMTSLRNFAASTTVAVQCFANTAGVGAEQFGIQAIKIG